jgi:hypothetical protein
MEKQITINAFAIVTVIVGSVLFHLGLVSGWVILLIVLSQIKVDITFKKF